MAKAKEYPVNETPKVPPVHPGEILREDVLPALGLNVTEVARALRVSRQTLHRILSGTMAVSRRWPCDWESSAATDRALVAPSGGLRLVARGETHAGRD